MTASDTPRGAIEVGKVIQDTFSVLGRNFVAFFLLSLILTGLPSAVFGYLQMTVLAEGMANTSGAFTVTVLGVLVSVVAGTVLQGALTHGAVMDMNGRPPSVADSLAVGLRNFLPLIGLALVTGLAVALGLILLIVPGVLLMLAWAVVVPAYIAERVTFFGAYERSASLTRNNRWKIFLLVLLYLVAAFVLTLIIGVVTGIAGLVAGSPLFVQSLLVTPFINTLFGMLGATGTAVLYANLRTAKEGLNPDSLAAIFD